MSYTYDQWVTYLGNELFIPTSDPNFQTQLPLIIDQSEQDLYRALDLLNCIIRDSSATLTPNSRDFTLPQSLGRFVGTESMNIFTTVGVTSTGRQPLTPNSRETIDRIWGNETASFSPSIPDMYAMITDQTIIVGPPPDAAYTMEVVGWIRPTPLSAANPTTYLTLYLPDLFFAKSMVFGYAYLKDFGVVGADDPQGSVTWQKEYDLLFQSANVEEQRKKYSAGNWMPKSPNPLATPPRA